MPLNLNNAKDFATLTLSNASSLLNQLAGLNNEIWDIQESSYGHPPGAPVLFHVFKSPVNYNGAVGSVQDTISRRVVPFRFPYIDGQTTDDLGGEGETFDFDILLFGKNYYAAYVALIKEFNKPAPGILIHPVRGAINAKFKGAIVMHKNSEKNAVTLRATFISHDFDVSFTAAKDTTKSALATAVGFISAINNVLNKIDSNLNVISNVRNAIKASVAQYQSDYTSTMVAMNTTFNNGTSADIPGLLPVNNGGVVTTFPVAESPNDPFSATTPAQIQAIQSPALASLQAIDRVSALRVSLNGLIGQMASAPADGVANAGALVFYDDILTLKQSSVAMQRVLELGLQSSQATIKNYTVPRLMSVREVCFLNGLSVDRSYDLEVLNPALLSLNQIPSGTVMQVPTV